MPLVSAERKAEILEQAVKDAVKRHEKWEDELLESGFGVFSRGKPQQRLQAYIDGTEPEDLDTVMNPDYWQLRAQGQAQPLVAEVKAQEYAQVQAQYQQLTAMAQKEGVVAIPPPPDVQPPRMMWVHLAALPNRMLERISRDFATLYRAESKKVVAQVETLIQEMGL